MVTGIITICNKLNRIDSNTGLDVWFKNFISGCDYKVETIASVVDTKTSIGQIFTVLIPFSDDFLNYKDWKEHLNKSEKFTLSVGDVLFIDEVIEEEITPTSIIALKNSHKSNCCEIRSINEVKCRNGVKYQFKVSGV